MSEIDHEYTDEIVCPWCGYKMSDSWEMSDDGEYDCDCGKSFEYTRNYSVDYSTSRTRCKHNECKLVLMERWGDNPYIYSDKNWTIWQCKTCKSEVVKASNFVGNKPRLELPVMSDFK